jgi:hypothetical protein
MAEHRSKRAVIRQYYTLRPRARGISMHYRQSIAAGPVASIGIFGSQSQFGLTRTRCHTLTAANYTYLHGLWTDVQRYTWITLLHGEGERRGFFSFSPRDD